MSQNRSPKPKNILWSLQRPANVLQADRGYILQVDEAHVLLDKKLLQHVGASIDVRAKLCSTYHLQGPWSEWSSSVELPAADSQKTGGRDAGGRLSVTWDTFQKPPSFWKAVSIVFTCLFQEWASCGCTCRFPWFWCWACCSWDTYRNRECLTGPTKTSVVAEQTKGKN